MSHNWTPAKVGCYWHWRSFTIDTVHFDGSSWYSLVRDFEELGRYDSLYEAQLAAEETE